MRNLARFHLLTTLGVAVLAGYGVATLGRRLPPPAARWAGPLLVGFAIAGTAPWHAIAVTRLPDSPVYATLRAEARRVLYRPVASGDSVVGALDLYHVTRTRVPMLNGYSPLAPRWYDTEVLLPLRALNVGDVGRDEHARLRRLGVSHIVLDRAQPGGSPFPFAFVRARLAASPVLSLAHAGESLWLFRLGPEPPDGSVPVSSPVGVFFEAEALPREGGAVAQAEDASGRRLVRARAQVDRPGPLLVTPAVLLPRGAYRATVRTRGTGLAVEVVAAEGRAVLARAEPEPGAAWTEVSLRFLLDRAAPTAVRVGWGGGGDAAVDWIGLVFADRPEPEEAFEIEALSNTLAERRDPAASGGWAGYAGAGARGGQDVVTGPARRYPAGRYRLALRARVERPAAGAILAMMVTESSGRILATSTVDAGELPADGYREVGFDFALIQPSVLDFPIRYLGGPGVYLDRLRVRPRT